MSWAVALLDPMTRWSPPLTRPCLFVAAAILLAAARISAQSAPASVIRSVAFSPRADEAVVTIVADGVLGPPTIGVAKDAPPRIYIDFAGVRPPVRGVSRTPDPR